MKIPRVKVAITGILAAMLVAGGQVSLAETLNPEGVNPHAAAPRKRITEEQKKAAWEAKKKKKAEIEARKAARKAGGTIPYSPYEPTDPSRPESSK